MSVPPLPLLSLVVRCGDLELRGITDDLLGPLADLAVAGVHDPATMPFLLPWTDAPAATLPLAFAQFHWGRRAAFRPDDWHAELAVLHRGELVGVQGASACDFRLARTAETGSWLGRAHQGRGLGTQMRRVMCTLLLDHLGAEQVTSSAFVDNHASLAVSRRLGYRDNGEVRDVRRGRLALRRNLVLRPEDLVRPDAPLEIEGLDVFRRSIGLD